MLKRFMGFFEVSREPLEIPFAFICGIPAFIPILLLHQVIIKQEPLPIAIGFLVVYSSPLLYFCGALGIYQVWWCSRIVGVKMISSTPLTDPVPGVSYFLLNFVLHLGVLSVCLTGITWDSKTSGVLGE